MNAIIPGDNVNNTSDVVANLKKHAKANLRRPDLADPTGITEDFAIELGVTEAKVKEYIDTVQEHR